LPFADNSFDTIWSHTVYEHLRYPELTVSEVYRVLKKGGIIIHHIDLRDHLILDENNPDTFNMLKYSDKTWWKMTSNRSIYVNRLRSSEWLNLHSKVGHKNIKLSIYSKSEIVLEYLKKGKLNYLKKFSNDDASIAQIKITATK
jgi:SAM-dependent methyltransferase